MFHLPPSRRFKTRVLVLLAGGMALFVLLAISGYRSLLAVESATAKRAAAREALLQMRTLLSDLKDVETGQRGFVLTGEAAYLEPYQRGLAQSAASLERYLVHVPAALLQRYPPAELRALIDARLRLARLNIATRQREGFNAALARVMSNAGRDAMNRVRARFGQIDTALREEIDHQNATVRDLRNQAWWLAWGLTAVGVGLTLGAYLLLLNEQRRRAQAEQALAAANARLEDTVKQRTAELLQARGEIETFARRLDRSIEAERRRLAREVHDQLGQVFTALKMTLNHGVQAADKLAAAASDMSALLDEGVATARRIAAELRPPLLDDLGLAPALVHQAQRFAEQSGIACTATVADGESLSAEQATQLYRIAQEALTNVARHAGATRVWIEGEACAGGYQLSVEDDGVGLSDVRADASGMLNMRERALLAGGGLELSSGRAGGLRVTATLPMEAARG
ncbi:MAG: hypothetical protein B7Y26_05005 [Hydrogenophilales bacterium 16-64-46]|nr:MAG: hypothetical protein B7Z32_04185 [Hydrogenophilales bacterium 12-64-13]OYZ06325.1 MAG: hypothetical protein B7Y26_05005 [Hydrogenophilales bacterium 16-64-46]OZA38776.1 MAG: hypothetical protein B7X87_04885 [Hydrogenophilales bacterium 17-64-34]HQS99597.1 CHASE3 domain-containing protein [Thiobacillus sp.]